MVRSPRKRFRQDQDWSRPFKLNKDSQQAKGLVLWLPTLGFLGGNVLRDRSGFGNDGLFPGGSSNPNWTTDSQRGIALDYDGVDDYISMPTSGIGNLDVFTFTAWLYLDSYGETSQGRVIDHDDLAVNLVCYVVDTGAKLNSIRFISDRWDTDGAWTPPNGTMSTGRWYFVSCSYDYGSTSNEPSIYIDGSLVTAVRDTTPAGSLNDVAQDMVIGNNNTQERTFDGRIDDFRFYNRILSPSEVYQLYAPQTRWELFQPVPKMYPVVLPTSLPAEAAIRPRRRTVRRQNQDWSRPFQLNKDSPQAKGLVGWWPLLGKERREYVTGATLTDATNTTNDPLVGLTAGFDGAATYLATPSSAKRRPANITVSVWCRPTAVTAYGAIFAQPFDTAGWDTPYFTWNIVRDDVSNNLQFRTSTTDVDSSGAWTSAGVPLVTGDVVHLAITYDGATGKGYINGKYDSENVNPDGVLLYDGSNPDLMIGMQSVDETGSYWQGQIWDARIYDYAMSAEQIAQLYHPQTRWDLYEPIPRVYPVSVTEATATVIGPFPTHFRIP